MILCGDTRQHGPVERGAALRLLETDAGLVPAEVSEVQRQTGAYKRAVEHLAGGRTADGFHALDQLGWVREVPDGRRYQALADEYVRSVVAGRDTLVVSPTHAEAGRVGEAIRAGLRQAGLLGRDERTVDVLTPANLTAAERADPTSYDPGDVLVFHQNAKGFKKGTRLTVAAGTALPLEQAERFTAYRAGRLALAAGDRVRVTANGRTREGHRLHNGDLHTVAAVTPAGDVALANGWTVDRSFGHLARGFVVTSHASQGKSVDKVIVAISAASAAATSAEQFYVSASRGRSELTVFTDAKADLLRAAERPEDRPTATAFVAGRDPRAIAVRLHRAAMERVVHLDPDAVPATRGREREAYER